MMRSKHLLCAGSVFILLSLSGLSLAQDSSDDIQARMNANKSRISASDHPHGFALAARRVLSGVGALRTNYSLSDADVEKIAAAGPPSGGRDAIRPHLLKIKAGLQEGGNTVELARILEQARAAEQEADEQHYRAVIASLSSGGQSVVRQEIERERPQTFVNEVNYVAFAAERPMEMEALLRKVVTKFDATEGDGNRQTGGPDVVIE